MHGSSDPQSDRLGPICGLAAYTIWGLLTLFWRQLRDFDAFELIGWRVLSSTVTMAAALSVTRRWSAMRAVAGSRRLLAAVIVSALLLTGNWTGYVYAVVHGHVIETALGYFIAPLGTMAVGIFVLRERWHAGQALAVALAIAAVIVLTWSYGRVPWLALLIAISWTAYGYSKKRVPLSPVESLAAEAFVLAVPAAVLVLALAGRVSSVPSTASGGQLVLVALTGAATVVPLMLFAAAAKRVPLTILGPMNYIVPILNFFFGWLLFHEALPPSRVVGFLLVWVALAVLTADSVRRARLGRLRLQPAG